MQTDPQAALAAAARALLEAIADVGPSVRLRATDVWRGLACQILVWEANAAMPAAAADRQERRAGGRRGGCRDAVLAALAAEGKPLTRAALWRVLKSAGGGFGRGTLAKVLADMTRDGEFVNPKDKKGYRLPQWRRWQPRLFN